MLRSQQLCRYRDSPFGVPKLSLTIWKTALLSCDEVAPSRLPAVLAESARLIKD